MSRDKASQHLTIISNWLVRTLLDDASLLFTSYPMLISHLFSANPYLFISQLAKLRDEFESNAMSVELRQNEFKESSERTVNKGGLTQGKVMRGTTVLSHRQLGITPV